MREVFKLALADSLPSKFLFFKLLIRKFRTMIEQQRKGRDVNVIVYHVPAVEIMIYTDSVTGSRINSKSVLTLTTFQKKIFRF